MRLTVLGCAGSFPSARSPASSYLLEHDGHRIVLDLGSGAYGALQRFADPYRLDAVVLSHLHPDHCADLCGYYVAQAHHPDGPRPPVAVHGPAGTADRAAAMFGMPAAPGMRGAFDFVDHVPAYEVGPFQITTTRVVHPVEAYALRITADGRTLVYSGDTAPTPALVEASRGADLALFEASFLQAGDNPPGLHLTAREAGQHARAAGVPRLVLTHLVAWNDQAATRAEAGDAYDGELHLAEPGAGYDV